MPRILLIDANTTPFNEALPVYPVGLDYVQGALKNAGFGDTHLLDLRQAGGDLPGYEHRGERSRDVISHYLEEGGWDIIGIGIRNIDSTYPPDPDRLDWHYYLPQVKEYAELIQKKAGPKTPIILGGSGFSMMAEEILDYFDGDYCGVVGPAEAILPQLIADIEANRPRQRLYRADKVSISSLQNTALLKEYRPLDQGRGIVGLRTRNGCGQHCSYCPYPGISGDHITLKDVSIIIDEIRMLRELGFGSFTFADDVFNAPPTHAKEVLAAMLDSGEVPASWHAYINPRDIDKELLELALDTNGWSHYREGRRTVVIPFDLDSGCDRILSRAGKGFATKDIRQSLAALEDVRRRREKSPDIDKVEIAFHLLLGFPGEDEDSIHESCLLINEVLPAKFSLQLGVRIYPHTPLAAETRGTLWQEPHDLLVPTFVPFSKGEIATWLRRYLDPGYRLLAEAGHMVQFVRGTA